LYKYCLLASSPYRISLMRGNGLLKNNKHAFFFLGLRSHFQRLTPNFVVWKYWEKKILLGIISNRDKKSSLQIHLQHLLGLDKPSGCLLAGSLSSKETGRENEADRSRPYRPVFENVWSYTSTIPYIFLIWCWIKRRQLLRYYLYASLHIIVYTYIQLKVQQYRYRPNVAQRVPGS